MPRIPMRSTASEMLETLNKQWLDTKDIKILACVGLRRAKEIKDDISETLKNEKYFLPNGLVPSEKVIEYLNLNIKYLKKIANNQIENGG